MSWGIKITVLYSSFVILIVTMVGMATKQKIDLVSSDYYEQELKYQDKINRINRTEALEQGISWSVQKDKLILSVPNQFKGKTITGKVYFFRPSDAGFDNTVEIPNDTLSNKEISTINMKKGMYKIQIDWKSDNNEYYNEGVIQLN